MIQTMKKLINFTDRHKRKTYLACLYSFLFSLCEMMTFYGIVMTLNYLTMDYTGYKSQLNWSVILNVTLILSVSLIGKILFGALSNNHFSMACFNACSDKRISIGNKIKQLPMGFFHAYPLGDISNSLTTAINDIEACFTLLFTNIIVASAYTLCIVVMLFFIHPLVACTAIVTLALGFMMNQALLKQSKNISPKRQAAQRHLVGAVLEYIQGISLIKAFGIEKDGVKRLKEAIEDSCSKNIALENITTKLLCAYKFVFKVSSCLILWIVTYDYVGREMSMSYYLIVLLSSFVIYSSIEKLGDATAFIYMVDASLRKLKEIDDAYIEPKGRLTLEGGYHEIEFQEVSFAYDKEVVLNNLNLTIHPGETVALVGPSGSGKSTICHLLMGFWSPQKGRIKIGGHPIDRLSSDQLLSHMSIVFQRVYLFEDTILNNIRFADPHASEEKVIEASKKACCHDFISSLPDGYNTRVKEGGQTLSGGERQRIAIARAILKDAPIVILDEATASVDPVNEVLIHKGITALTKNKTVILVAHSLGTIKDAHHIFVLNKGQIVESGEHNHLMSMKGLYHKLVTIKEKACSWQL